jgi:hypothetical protein
MQMLSNVFRKNADARRALFFQNNTIRQREKQCKLTGTFLQLPKNKVVIALCKETVADLTSTTNQDDSGILVKRKKTERYYIDAPFFIKFDLVNYCIISSETTERILFYLDTYIGKIGIGCSEKLSLG